VRSPCSYSRRVADAHPNVVPKCTTIAFGLMDDSEKLRLAAALLGGGAMGAIINAILTSYRNRVQPVGQRTDVIAIFSRTLDDTALPTAITVEDGGVEHRFTNLFIAEVVITNRGNRDIKDFRLGITLDDGDSAINATAKGADRMHVAEQLTKVCPATSSDTIDFILTPFNRRDSYSLKLWLVAPDGKAAPGAIKFSSDEAVRFVRMPTVAELMQGALIELKVGPLSITRPNR